MKELINRNVTTNTLSYYNASGISKVYNACQSIYQITHCQTKLKIRYTRK